MASGARIADDLVNFFNDMKLQKGGDQRVRVAIFGFDDKCIDVKETYTQAQLDEKKMDCFEFFMSLLQPEKCRYIVYDCHFATKESSTKEELVFIMWCPPDSIPKHKMNYAASKEVLVKKLNGVKHSLQINDLSDCPDRATFAENLGKTVISVEGVPL